MMIEKTEIWIICENTITGDGTAVRDSLAICIETGQSFMGRKGRENVKGYKTTH